MILAVKGYPSAKFHPDRLTFFFKVVVRHNSTSTQNESRLPLSGKEKSLQNADQAKICAK
jgi:hypothetical protein